MGMLRAFGLVFLGLALILISRGSISSGESAPLVGYDISFPQCPNSFPEGGDFGIVGVTNGLAWSKNPCLGTQWQWAKSLPNPPAFYTNTGNPGPISAYWDLPGPRQCQNPDSYNDTGCAYNYGWNAAADAFAVASATTSAADARNHDWWLDVETANSWNGDFQSDRASIQGFIDYFHGVGVPKLGIYSTTYQWGVITGSWQLPAIPNWVAGPSSASNAPSYCEISFTGGPVQLVQYPSGSFSANLVCGSDAGEAPTATVEPTAEPTSTTESVDATSTPVPTGTAEATSTAEATATPPAAPPGEATSAEDGFESGNWRGGSGWQTNWSTSGSPRVESSSGTQSGRYHARLRRQDSITRRVDLAGTDSATLSFGAKASSWESRDGARVQVSSNGKSWKTLLSFANGQDDGRYANHTIDLSGYSGTLWLRFASTSNATSDYFYVDNVTIDGQTGGEDQAVAESTATSTPPPAQTSTMTPSPTPSLSPTMTATPRPASASTATPVPTPAPWWCRYFPSMCS